MQLQLIGSICSVNVRVAIASVAVSCRISKALGAKAFQLGARGGGGLSWISVSGWYKGRDKALKRPLVWFSLHCHVVLAGSAFGADEQSVLSGFDGVKGKVQAP